MRLLVLLLTLIVSMTSNAQRLGKMSRLVQDVASSHMRKAGQKEQGSSICAFVKFNCDADSILAAHNCKSLAHWGNIHIASIPLQNIRALSNQKEVLRIEAHERNILHMDNVRIIDNIQDCHDAHNLQKAYTGKGVVVGVQDIGFDLTHPNFFTSDMQEYRIKAFWDMLDNSDETSQMFVGKDFTTQEAILAKAYATDGLVQSHGTHTTGIAAGSGAEGANITSQYVGAAPEADICLVANAVNDDLEFIAEEDEYKFTSATDMLGFKYIFDYAESVGKPCVINFSEGSHEDLYGDCQLLFEVLEEMTGPGRIIVASAGNESLKLTYMHKPFGQDHARGLIYSNSKNAYFTLSSSAHQTLRLDFTRNSSESLPYTINTEELLELPDTLLTDTIEAFSQKYAILCATYPSCYDNSKWATELLVVDLNESTPGSGKQRIGLTLSDADKDIECFASGGYFILRNDYPEWTDVEATHNIHFPGCAPSVICVGNSAWCTGHYNYEGIWKGSDDGQNGVIATSSSVGPTMAGITKPDVVAPGMHVVASFNSFFKENDPTHYVNDFEIRRFEYNSREYAWGANSGTSMSSPVVAGTIALWLEANPTLSPQDIMEVIAATARHHDESLSYPNNEYGWGEIDAYAGLLHVLNLDKIESISRHNPEKAIVSVKGGRIVIFTDREATSPLDIRIYNTSGQLLSTHIMPCQSSEYEISTDLPSGIYAVQINSQDKSCQGSQLIRIKK